MAKKFYILKHMHKYGTDAIFFRSNIPYEAMDPVNIAHRLGVDYDQYETLFNGYEYLELAPVEVLEVNDQEV